MPYSKHAKGLREVIQDHMFWLMIMFGAGLILGYGGTVSMTPDRAQLGLFGDSFGPFGAIFNGIALLAAIRTIWLQHDALAREDQERKTRDAERSADEDARRASHEIDQIGLLLQTYDLEAEWKKLRNAYDLPMNEVDDVITYTQSMRAKLLEEGLPRIAPLVRRVSGHAHGKSTVAATLTNASTPSDQGGPGGAGAA